MDMKEIERFKALKEAIEYESKNLDESSFETDADYRYAIGHADGLSDALEILQDENYKRLLDIER